jgi:hypothetical protein
MLACGKNEPKPSPTAPGSATSATPKPSPIAPGSATSAMARDAAPSIDAPPAGPRMTDICSRIDAAALAKAVGVPRLLPAPTNGLVQPEVDEHSVSCTWNSNRQDYETELSFSVSVPANLDEKDPLDRFEWDDFDGLGQPAKVGVSSGGLYIQTVVHGVLLNASLDNPAETNKSRFDKRLVAAMKIVMKQLPANVQDTLR